MAAAQKARCKSSMAKNSNGKELSLEEAFSRIENTIGRLEEESITLEASFKAYQEGMELLKYCNERIDRVEKQVMQINEDGELREF